MRPTTLGGGAGCGESPRSMSADVEKTNGCLVPTHFLRKTINAFKDFFDFVSCNNIGWRAEADASDLIDHHDELELSNGPVNKRYRKKRIRRRAPNACSCIARKVRNEMKFPEYTPANKLVALDKINKIVADIPNVRSQDKLRMPAIILPLVFVPSVEEVESNLFMSTQAFNDRVQASNRPYSNGWFNWAPRPQRC